MHTKHKYAIWQFISLMGIVLLLGACSQADSVTRIQSFATLEPTATALAMAEPTFTPEPSLAEQSLETSTMGDDAPQFTVVNVTLDDVLNMRQGPGVTHPIVGTIPPFGSGVQATGQQEQVNGSAWVEVQFANQRGWVNQAYLARQFGSLDVAVIEQATRTIQAIKAQDWQTLSTLIDPEQGVRFSPYGYLQPDDLIFDQAQIQNIAEDETEYQWGSYDGSGEPINLTFAAYYDRFIYPVEFAQPEIIGLNTVIGQGNSINNIAEVYPAAVFVEYHFSGFDAKFGGMDWRSLRLVFEQRAGAWYLVGIVHDQWTI